MKKWMKMGTIVSAGVLGGAAVTTAVILPFTLIIKKKAEAARDGLDNYVPGSGSNKMENWDSEKNINYVALGDSETAGYNAFLQKDYLSYADFLANDLNNNARLSSYKNFAVSGGRLGDMNQLIAEDLSIQPSLQKADLITLTIGANDLLAFVKFLDLPFGTLLSGVDGILNTIMGSGTTSIREDIFGPEGLGFDNTNSGLPPNFYEDTVKESLQILDKMIKEGNYTNVITIQQEYKSKVFDLIKRNFAVLIHDLHNLAPNAQIIVLGHAMPFAQWPDQILNGNHAELDNQSLLELFDVLLKNMEDGAKENTSGENNYVTFKSVDDLVVPESSDPANDVVSEGKTFKEYVKKDDYFENPDFYIQNPMNNSMDIHPSTFGHELIGSSIYSFLSEFLEIPDPIYTLSEPVKYVGDTLTLAEDQKEFARLDENKNIDRSGAEQMYNLLRSTSPDNQYATRGGNLYGTLNTELINGSSIINVLGSVEDWSLITTIGKPKANELLGPILSGIGSDDIMTTLIKLIAAVSNQNPDSLPIVDTDVPKTPFNPSLTPIIDEVLSDLNKMASSIVVSDDVTQSTKNDLVSLFGAVTGIVNFLRVSKNPSEDFEANKKLIDTFQDATKDREFTGVIGEEISILEDAASPIKILGLIGEIVKNTTNVEMQQFAIAVVNNIISEMQPF